MYVYDIPAIYSADIFLYVYMTNKYLCLVFVFNNPEAQRLIHRHSVISSLN